MELSKIITKTIIIVWSWKIARRNVSHPFV